MPPPGRVTVTSPSSASASSAVTIKPGRHRKPLERDRREWTATTFEAAFATRDSERGGKVLEAGSTDRRSWGFLAFRCIQCVGA